VGEAGRKKGRQEIYGGRHRLRQGIYAVTSHSSLGQTADLVLIHVDTEKGAKDLLNNRMAYVAVSRGAYDAQIFTNDREKLGAALGLRSRTAAPMRRR
jgi:ATP-dependent exoDNAse (exonuclease V) alpha subunit